MKIDGKKIASEVIQQLKEKPQPRKFFAAIVIGEDEQLFGFVERKEAVAKELEIDFRIYKFPAELNNDAARREVWKIAKHKTCGGVIVQLPLPSHLNPHYVMNVIPKEKDVDVLSEQSLGALYTGRNPVPSPVVGTVEKILANIRDVGDFKRAAVVGRGILVGKPVATWLMNKVSELYVLGRGSDFGVLQKVEIVISGVGNAGLIKPDILKEGAGVIDFGYNFADGKLTGDLDTSSPQALSKLLFYTPTPGGTGPILVAQLFENFYRLENL